MPRLPNALETSRLMTIRNIGVLALALTLIAAACSSTLGDAVEEQSADREVPEPAGSPDQSAGSGDVAGQVDEAVPGASHDESTVDEDLDAVSEARLGSRFGWCSEVQAEWDALDEAAEHYLLATDAWLDVQIELPGIADALDAAEAEFQAARRLELLQERESELEVAARAVGDRVHASAWVATLSEVGGEINVDLIRYWQDLFGYESAFVDTSDKTLEVAYDRAWRAFISSEIPHRLVVGYYWYYLMFELGGETYEWRAFADIISSAIESARREFYLEDSFADILRSDSERFEDVDANLQEAYDAVQNILELEFAFLNQLDDFETWVHTHLPSWLPQQVTDEVVDGLSNIPSSFRVFFNYMDVRGAIEAYEDTALQESIAEALLAQEVAFEAFEQVLVGLSQEPSAALIERFYWRHIYSDWEKLVAGATLREFSDYIEIQDKWMELMAETAHTLATAADAISLADFTASIGLLRYLDDSAIDGSLMAHEAFQESIQESCRLPS